MPGVLGRSGHTGRLKGTVKICKECGKEFEPRQEQQEYCPPVKPRGRSACRRQAKLKRRAMRWLTGSMTGLEGLEVLKRRPI